MVFLVCECFVLSIVAIVVVIAIVVAIVVVIVVVLYKYFQGLKYF
jgi:hypothetical protein